MLKKCDDFSRTKHGTTANDEAERNENLVKYGVKATLQKLRCLRSRVVSQHRHIHTFTPFFPSDISSGGGVGGGVRYK